MLHFTLPVLSNICISYVRIINNIRVSPKEYYAQPNTQSNYIDLFLNVSQKCALLIN